MGSNSLDDLNPQTRAAAEQLLAYASENGIELLVTSTFRTCAEQDALYAQSRTAPGPRVTGAPGCRSWHTHGRALDVLVKEPDGKVVSNGLDPRYAQLGEHARTLGFKWGGDFGDYGHFEYHPGLTISQACPDPSDCTHLGQPRSTAPPPAPPEPSAGASPSAAVVLAGLVIGAVAFAAVDMKWGATDGVLSWVRGQDR